MRPAAKDTEEYLAGVPEDMRQALQQLRQTIKAAVPDAVEVISYGIPSFKYRGRLLVSFGAAKKHYAFYPGALPIAVYKDELQAYGTSKGTVRFMVGKPLPEELVTKLVKARMQENEAASKK
ncbi:MAG TPA: DUF1801 domain-containing protein [Dehalococcoidia bacterium]|nr:DUF1801 domain-containing protein [Dehalococcoidia bacterium]